MNRMRHNYGITLWIWAVCSGLVIAISYCFFSLDLTHAQAAQDSPSFLEEHKTTLIVEEKETVGRDIADSMTANDPDGDALSTGSTDGLAHVPSKNSVGNLGSKPNSDPSISSSSSVTVAFGSARYRVNEGEPVQVTVRLSTGAPEALSIPVSIGRGTAETGDYRVSGLSSGSLSYSRGSNSASFIIVALQDNDTEDETLNLTFGTLPGDVASGSITTATIEINDDDQAKITLTYSATNYRVNEGDPVQVTASLSTAATQALRIPITIARGTAETGDYQISGIANETISFSQGSRSSSFIVLARGDNDTADETLYLAFGALPSSVALGTNPVAKITIRDDDTSRIGLSYSAVSYHVNEGEPVQVTAQLSSATAQALRIPVTISRDSAEAGDYRATGLSDGALSFSQGSRTASFIIVANQDNDTVDETLTFSFGNLPDGVAAGSTPAATLTIIDDDRAKIAVAYSSASYQVEEGRPLQVTVQLSTPAPRAVRIPITIGRGTAETSDYQVSGLSGGYINISQGSRSASFLIAALQDSDTADESLALAFGHLPAGFASSTIPKATLTISDDDRSRISLSFSSAEYRVNEGDPVQVTVGLSTATTGAVRIPVSIARGTAETNDYQVSGLSGGFLDFSKGSRTASFIIMTRHDNDGDDETLTLSFTGLPGNVINGAQPIATLTISDDERANIGLSYSSANYGVNEGEPVQVTARLSVAASYSLSIPVTVSGGNAERSDYRITGLSNGSLSFSRGSRTASFIVVALHDTDADDEVLTLTFGNLPVGVVEGANQSATVAISDDERANIGLSYSSTNYRVNEGDPVQVTATLSTAAPQSLRVPVTLGQGTAEAGDYWVSGLAGGYLNFGPGSRTASFLIVALHDNDSEDEVVDVGFGTLPEGLTAGSVSGAALIISDDELPPPLQLKVYFGSAQYAVSEGYAVTVTVQLSANSDRELLVPITVSNQSAEDGDYHLSGLINGALYFPPGDRSESFILFASQDDDTDDEQVRLGLGALPADTTSGQLSTGYVTIDDDDMAPVTIEAENSPPAFTERETTTREVMEQSSVGTSVGLPVTALDPDGDLLTYQVGGVDASYFSIDSRTGQLKVQGRLDLEIKPTYILIVSVADGRGATDSIEVSVDLSDTLEVPLTAPSRQSLGLTAPGTILSLETPDRMATFRLPPDFHESPLFVLVESALVDCKGRRPAGDVQAYSTVQFFDTWGNPLNTMNMETTRASLRLDAMALGGVEAVYTAYSEDRFKVYRHQEGSWTPSNFSLGFEDPAVGELTVSNVGERTCLLAVIKDSVPAQSNPVSQPMTEPDVEEAVALLVDRESPPPQPTDAPGPPLVEPEDGASPNSFSTDAPNSTQAGMGSEVPWWPRPLIAFGSLLLLAALSWLLLMVVKERRRLGKTYARPENTKATDATHL